MRKRANGVPGNRRSCGCWGEKRLAGQRRLSRRGRRKNGQSGFSLIEMLVAVAIMTLVMGVLFAQLNDVQKMAGAEQAKLDLFQESRAFMDQMTRDLRFTGYPNTHNYSTSPQAGDPSVAAGLIYVGNNDLWFEGSIDGSPQVYLIQYHLDNTCTPLPCLRRAQTQKQMCPLTSNLYACSQQMLTNYQTEVQNVANGTANDPNDPIFEAYTVDVNNNVTQVTLPVDMYDNGDTVADINTIRVKLTVQSPYPDPKTGQYPMTTMLSTIRVHNCSDAYTHGAVTALGC